MLDLEKLRNKIENTPSKKLIQDFYDAINQARFRYSGEYGEITYTGRNGKIGGKGMRCCDKCDDTQKVLKEEFIKKLTNKIDMEKLCGDWKSEVDEYVVYNYWRCPDCGHVEETDDIDFLPNFCPDCGLAMTEKGKEILRKRLEVLKDV